MFKSSCDTEQETVVSHLIVESVEELKELVEVLQTTYAQNGIDVELLYVYRAKNPVTIKSTEYLDPEVVLSWKE